MKTLNLEQKKVFTDGNYKVYWDVMSVVNSIIPKIHDSLEEDEVKEYCDNPMWKVTIK